MSEYDFIQIKKSKYGIGYLDDDTINVTISAIRFANNLTILFKGSRGCDIFIDNKRKAIALKPSVAKIAAFVMGRSKKIINIRNTRIGRFIKSNDLYGRYKVERKKEMLIINKKNRII